jgi:hypothetical protein
MSSNDRELKWSYIKNNVKLYNCAFNPETIALKDSPGVYYMETDAIEI